MLNLGCWLRSGECFTLTHDSVKLIPPHLAVTFGLPPYLGCVLLSLLLETKSSHTLTADVVLAWTTSSGLLVGRFLNSSSISKLLLGALLLIHFCFRILFLTKVGPATLTAVVSCFRSFVNSLHKGMPICAALMVPLAIPWQIISKCSTYIAVVVAVIAVVTVQGA